MTLAEPIYRAIARSLRSQIASGALQAGDLLPTELMLTAQYGVSRHTAREALQLLRSEGLITRQRGVGTIVTPRVNGVYTQAVNGVADLLQYARDARLAITTFGPASATAVKSHQLDVGLAWIRIAGVRLTATQAAPVALTQIFISADVCPPRDVIERHEGALNELIADRTGVRAARIDQEIAAVALSKAEAKTLRAEPNGPALSTLRAYHDASGALFQLSVSLHPGDRFTYRMRLDRN